MESSSSRLEQDRKKQTDILEQIAALQAQLAEIPQADTILTAPKSTKRKRPEPTMLAPPTPSPKKRNLANKLAGQQPKRSATQYSPNSPLLNSSGHNPKLRAGRQSTNMVYAKLAPSDVLNKLARLSTRPVDTTAAETVKRSASFDEKPSNITEVDNVILRDSLVPTRDERLALIEDLEPGPFDHVPPSDDPHFKQFEPNSGVRLSSRIIPHDDIQDHLRGRYYLSPSRLYSAIRLLPDKQVYHVPVSGDWITIAVVAERGPIKFSRAPVPVGPEEDGDGNWDQKDRNNKGKERGKPGKLSGKKYVNLKLIDFGARSRSSSGTGGKAPIRGDAFLSLLLFESDGFDLVTYEGEVKPRKVYKGGSRGAFEYLERLKEGDVIALLNPKILKPFQRSSSNPHATDNILAITPECASSIIIIGRARDLGMCAVMKRDGKVCGSWCDKRVSDVCEWHVQNAVERRRAGRAEFSVGTSGMSTSSAPKQKPAYDPLKQWGMKPADSDSGSGDATYIVAGHVVGGSGVNPIQRSLYIGELIGREGQARAKRKSDKDSDKALKALLEKDKEGMKTVMKAREVGKTFGKEAGGKKSHRECDKGKGRENDKETRRLRNWEPERGPALCEQSTQDMSNAFQHGYSAEVIKKLGFNPITTARQQKANNSPIVQKKLKALAVIQSVRKEITLGPRPGQKIHSGVVSPHPLPSGPNLALHDSVDPKDKTLKQPPAQDPKEEILIDLDESSQDELMSVEFSDDENSP